MTRLIQKKPLQFSTPPTSLRIVSCKQARALQVIDHSIIVYIINSVYLYGWHGNQKTCLGRTKQSVMSARVDTVIPFTTPVASGNFKTVFNGSITLPCRRYWENFHYHGSHGAHCKNSEQHLYSDHLFIDQTSLNLLVLLELHEKSP